MIKRGTWVRLTSTALLGPCIDSETIHGATQGVGSVENDNYDVVYIRWNAGLMAGYNYSWRKVEDLHILTPAECQQHQKWIDAP